MVATLWVAVGVYAVRLAAVYFGSWLGAWMGGTPTEHRRKVWQGMITQVLYLNCITCVHAFPLASAACNLCPGKWSIRWIIKTKEPQVALNRSLMI